jgi:hypothetical protein
MVLRTALWRSACFKWLLLLLVIAMSKLHFELCCAGLAPRARRGAGGGQGGISGTFFVTGPALHALLFDFP